MKASRYKKMGINLATTFVLGMLVMPAAYGNDESKYPADNSGKNVRDRQDRTLTPENQPENEKDRNSTQQIRKDLQGDKSLSVNAKNVKIITVDGRATLRGPVNSEAEKAKVCEAARHVVGNENVIDQLEVVAGK